MLLLNLIFLCNSVLFMFLLKERFKILITSGAYIIAFILSLIGENIVSSAYADIELHMSVSIIVNLAVLLIASIFVSSNNLVQKMLLAFVLYFSFSLTYLIFVTGAGYYNELGWGVTYLVMAVIIAVVFTAPFHYFYRKNIDTTFSVYCILAVVGIIFTNGFFDSMITSESVWFKYIVSSSPIIMIMFSVSLSYITAKAKARDVRRADVEIMQEILADNFNTMYISVLQIKNLKEKFVGNANINNPILETYCENPNLNAVIATKVTSALKKDIKIETNVDVDDKYVSVIDLCATAGHMLDVAVNYITEKECEYKQINFTAQQAGEKTNFEIIYANKKETLQSIHELTFEKIYTYVLELLIDNVFKKSFKKEDVKQELLAEIVQRYRGSMDTYKSDNRTRIKVSI